MLAIVPVLFAVFPVGPRDWLVGSTACPVFCWPRVPVMWKLYTLASSRKFTGPASVATAIVVRRCKKFRFLWCP
jgi:hypothetical protein